MKRRWTKAEIRMLGTKSDWEVGRRIGRPGKTVWAKRKALGIPAPAPIVRIWSESDDAVALTHPIAEAARILNRTKVAVSLRRSKLLRKRGAGQASKLLSLKEAVRRIKVSRYDSKEQEDKVRFVAGPYSPPLISVGGWLKCKLRGNLQVGGYGNALVPWPMAIGHARQPIICGDLLKALQTESRLAVSFHFGISQGMVSEYRRKLGIERLNAGSIRLFWRNIELARTDEARAKISSRHEGRGDTMSPEDREKLREVQRRPKPKAWRRKMAERWRRRFDAVGAPVQWTEEELKVIGSRPDREVAKLMNRSLSAVKAKKFQLRQTPRGNRNATL